MLERICMEAFLIAVCTWLKYPSICAGRSLDAEDIEEIALSPDTRRGNSTKVASPSKGHTEPQLHKMLWLAAVSAFVSMLMFG
jgi:hypothetical protein